MAGTDFTLQILRTVVTLVTVLCYTVTSCFVIARISSPLTSILPLPLLAVLYLNSEAPKPPSPPLNSEAPKPPSPPLNSEAPKPPSPPLNSEAPKPPSPPQQISHTRARGSWSAATGDSGDKWHLGDTPLRE
ncbi:uncharacterized protein CcaverHIS019_0300830 [Cutaneotrichosporon cavernicola]|uniref:Uncharacterized protein n=1 Tax=Cutaneotrichosporon cavernicola TaxID=279322 RepID=A0AA48IGE9_9TREE|nr:uncharacterized protein CcaverHIS019_0300830 [Cutaneotrichosporon cavernicola]BEI90013.1 hypothetical protein CcaverHIS019_0300830 [Cutaneotrichosporon cavernicola]BEI97786.1 hypothetical protein CcaverHIS631_0300850 [Cutaneotrichosporon cavernicola]